MRIAQTFHTRGTPTGRSAGGAFTLVEVLLALAICAIVVVAIQGVFATAVRLRDRTTSAVAEVVPVERAFEMLRHDLKGTVGPGGFYCGDFKCGVPTLGANMGISGEAAGGSGLDFFSATGVISDEAPWGDVQEVFYEVRASTDADQPGLELVRNVNRNLLSATLATPDTQTLLHGLASFELDCYDGYQWRSYWDTSSGDTNLPAAVRIRIQLASQEGEAAAAKQPLEMTVPLTIVTRTNFTAAAP